jgi:hypothetical protein
MAVDLRDAFKLDSNGTAVADTFESPAKLISQLLPNVYVFAGFLLLIFILGAGFKIVMSPGDAKQTESGKQAITFAFLGFFLLIGSYWIIQIIQVLTGVQILG